VAVVAVAAFVFVALVALVGVDSAKIRMKQTMTVKLMKGVVAAAVPPTTTMMTMRLVVVVVVRVNMIENLLDDDDDVE
jgi:TRAP-type C4-dicarboxylate transport system permease small subunit